MVSPANTRSYFQRSYRPQDILLLAFVFLCINIAVNFIYSLKGMGYPYNSFLVDPKDRFGDFFKVIDAFNIVKIWPGDNPYEGATQIYARPFASLYYVLFGKLILQFGHQYLIYAALCFTFLISIVLTSSIAGSNLKTIFLALVSYPVIFAIDRGNFAIIVFLFLLIALITRRDFLSTFLIAAAASLKITPLIFILPLLVREPITIRRTVKIIAQTAIWLLLINFFSAMILKQIFTTAQQGASELSDNLVLYTNTMITDMRGLGHGSSLYMPLVWISYQLGMKDYFLSHVKPILMPVVVGGVIASALTLKGEFIQKFRKTLSFENLIFPLCLSFVLFTPVSADYYLIILLLPLLIFPQTKYSFAYFLLYGVLLGAKNFVWLGDVQPGFQVYVSWQVFINPMLILILLFAEFDMIGFMKRHSSDSAAGENFLINYLRKVGQPAFQFLNNQKKIIVILAFISVLGGFTFYKFRKTRQEIHNIEAGLPADFDPAIYLRLNPGLEEFWKSQGINDSGQRLLNHAEEHYKSFGARDQWRYK